MTLPDPSSDPASDALGPATDTPPAPDRLDRLIDTLAENGYAIVPDFLPADTTAALLNELHSLYDQGRARAAGIGQDNDYRVLPSVRNDAILWLDPTDLSPARAAYSQALEDLRLRLNRACFLSLIDYECHFARYQPGGFYKRHLDVFRENRRRRISCVFYLNFNWTTADGGQLRLFLPRENGEITVDILPLAGRLVVFDSHTIEHEVLPALRPRSSLAGWFRTA
jgi:SM-20-related protein